MQDVTILADPKSMSRRSIDIDKAATAHIEVISLEEALGVSIELPAVSSAPPPESGDELLSNPLWESFEGRMRRLGEEAGPSESPIDPLESLAVSRDLLSCGKTESTDMGKPLDRPGHCRGELSWRL